MPKHLNKINLIEMVSDWKIFNRMNERKKKIFQCCFNCVVYLTKKENFEEKKFNEGNMDGYVR